MTISLGFSPCPNDTFIFDAMIHQKIDTEGLQFDLKIEDVAELNKMAFEEQLDITKISYHALGHLLEKYTLLNAGSALGNNCGPLLIGKKEWDKEAVKEANIAIPGKYTTANFLLGLAFPQATKKHFHLFSDIETAVAEERMDLGLIIHENRFTYQEHGLVKIIDLGEFWEKETGLPIPLGGIAVHRRLDLELQRTIDRVMRRSVQYAFDHPADTMAFVKQHAQAMEETVMKKHIALYVNHYTLALGEDGKQAVHYLYEKGRSLQLIPPCTQPLFVKI